MSAVSLERTIYEPDHAAFRETARRFAEREVAPHLEPWAAAGRVDRELYRQAGKLGLLGVAVPERFGGGGIDDFRFGAVLIEELARVGAQAVTMGLSGFNDLVAPYFTALGTEEQNHRWLAPMVAGEAIGAIAMTEPGAGSDLAAVATTAIPDGDHFVLNGSKIFISNGLLADTIIVVAKTDPAAGKNGVSLLVVEDGMPGFTKNGPLDKVGLSAQDTAELVFDDVRVPRANLLGEENRGFGYLRHNLPQERLSIAVTSMALMTRTFETALRYATDRTAFGQRIADFQANRFYLAELATEIEIAQVFVDRCILDAAHGRLDEVTAAMAKWWVTELHLKVVHRAVQLHGGYGFMKEYDVARDYLDSRAGTLYGGTTEIMKEIVGRRLTRT
ncbi:MULTISPECIES: acyl-CoA dehydrogenase family protein [Rhodococcus]|uniref:acyl-CoA dehydrogenase family protein n=1 Tax=Rhodococcus TaxID=1827 RepID=UPI00193BB398|nr:MULTISPECIES: acyl-CoA dehydrogenase family protein [Rhodococcus]QRI76322.1 acyl-CoA dehydrogenase family protein [Rhodococcus aetherivorans]QSE59733.1 acyl-CoA dehydrogenase family protein [Rhodococcus sp. PSBB066]QSE68958.1 acyl-CoA dehydrogenase family protein [Rhodococcus sp. PSBB049]